MNITLLLAEHYTKNIEKNDQTLEAIHIARMQLNGLDERVIFFDTFLCTRGRGSKIVTKQSLNINYALVLTKNCCFFEETSEAKQLRAKRAKFFLNGNKVLLLNV